MRPASSCVRTARRCSRAIAWQQDLRARSSASRSRPDAFYHGEIPKIVEAAAKKGGGLITAADFASYRAQDMAPLTCTYRGYEFVSAPPPARVA